MNLIIVVFVSVVKQNTKPATITYDIQYYNPFDFPIRIKLGYNQFENSPRLTTTIDIEQFKIVENGEEDRENYYEGFGSGTTEEIEALNFTSELSNNIKNGGLGKASLWIELKPHETKIFKDFLTTTMCDLNLLSASELYNLMNYITMYFESVNSLESIAFDFMTYGIFDGISQSDYGLDEEFNLFNALTLNYFLYSLKTVSNFEGDD